MRYNGRMTTLVAERLLTADEFLAMPEDEGHRLELWDGKVVYMSHPGEEHGEIAENIGDALKAFSSPHRLGRLVRATGFILSSSRVVGPDVAFMAYSDLDPARDRTKAFASAPTLAVEIVSPNDRLARVTTKALGYLEAGSRRVWVVNPRRRTVTVYRHDAEPRTLAGNSTLTSDDAGFAAEGFELTLDAIFASDE